MNKRQIAATARAAKALERLAAVGLTTIVDQDGALYVVPTKLEADPGRETSTYALVQDHGDALGGAKFYTGFL